MLEITAMDHVNIFVTDVKESLSFYEEIFGFKIKKSYLDNEKPGAIIGIPKVAYIAMYQVDELPEKVRISHFGFVLTKADSFEAAVSDLSRRGVKMEVIEWEDSKSMYIYDPDGHEIEISTNFGGNLD